MREQHTAAREGAPAEPRQTFFRVFRLTKPTFLLAFTIAGHNV